jgi:hypothetical protein
MPGGLSVLVEMTGCDAGKLNWQGCSRAPMVENAKTNPLLGIAE